MSGSGRKVSRKTERRCPCKHSSLRYQSRRNYFQLEWQWSRPNESQRPADERAPHAEHARKGVLLEPIAHARHFDNYQQISARVGSKLASANYCAAIGRTRSFLHVSIIVGSSEEFSDKHHTKKLGGAFAARTFVPAMHPRRVQALVLAAIVAAAAFATTPSVLPSAASAGSSLAPPDSTVGILLEVAHVNRSSVAAIAAQLLQLARDHNISSVNVTVLDGGAFVGVAVRLPATWAAALEATIAAGKVPSAAAIIGTHADITMTLSHLYPNDRDRTLNDVSALISSGAVSTQPLPAALWDLARLDSRAASTEDSDYEYSLAGSGVDVYIIDGGLNTEHVEFTGRIGGGANFVADQPATDVEDCQGHGTHVTGLAAGTTYGVAKLASIIPVRVYGCTDSGPVSAILSVSGLPSTSTCVRGAAMA